MTEREFDEYSFSIYTEANILDDNPGFHEYERIMSVDFRRRIIETESGYYISFEKIKDLRN